MARTFSLSKEKQAELAAEEMESGVIGQNQKEFSEDDFVNNGVFQHFSATEASDHHDMSFVSRNFAEKNDMELHSITHYSEIEDERDSAITSLVEDIQRHEMNFFDEASAISKLIRYYGLTQEDAAQKLGRAQSTVANKLRLLRLTDNERDLILMNKLTERHARSLLKLASIEDRMLMLDKIINNNLNVERTENMIENFIGRQRERNCYKKRSKIYQNVNSFISTINRAVESMQANGILANSKKIKGDDYIEFRVRITVKQ